MRRTGSGEEKVTVAKAVPLWLRAAFGVVFALLLAAGVFFYRTQEQALRLDAESDLQTVAELKVGQIAQWRAERLSDGAELTERPFAKDAILRWLADPRSEDVGDILIRFRSLGEYHHYFDVLLVDARGEIRLSLSGRKGRLQEDALRNLAAALENRCATLSDLHAGPGDLPPHLDVIAPLISGAGATAVLKGAVVMQSDARQFLYPLIRIWPEASRSAETLLVRREGDQVLFLNDLRHRSDSALEFRIPLSRLDSPAVLAVMGREGVVEGMDYRGIEVLTALKAVPDSPWFLVAKIDKSEALAGWRTSSVLIVALILAFAAAAGGALLVIWQRNAKAHYRALYREEASRRESEQRYRTAQKALAEAEARFRIASQSASDLVWDWEIASHRLDWFGDIDKALGYPRGEFPRTIKAWEKVIHPDDRDRVMAALDRHLKTKSPYLEEYRVRRKDGSVSYWRGSGSTLPDEKGKPCRMVGAVSDITERKQAELALAAERSLLRTVVDHLPDAVYVKDSLSRMTLANPVDVRNMGASSEAEVLGKTDFDFFPQDLAASFLADDQSVLRSGRPILNREEMIPLPDGTRGWLLTSKVPVRDSAGQVVGLVGVGHDITEWKRAGEQLLRSEAALKKAQQVAHVGSWTWHIQANRLEWSDEMFRIFGIDKNDFGGDLNEVIARAVHPEDRAAVEQANLSVIQEGKPVPLEYRVIWPDGTVRWVWAEAGELVLDDKGCPDILSGIVQDITERKRAEEALRESEEKYRSLVEQSLMGIAISLGNQVVFANPALLRILGYDDLEKFVKIPILDHVAPSSKEYIIARFDEVARGVPVPFEFEYNILRKDGVTRTLQATSTHFKLGDKTYTQTTFQDITERKSNEEKLKMALQEREVLLREIHHRVKNNIQIISSLLRLQSRSVKDETALDILNECQGRIRSIALIHEKLYQSQDFARIDFADYIQNMVIHLISFHSGVGGRVNFRLEAVDVKLDINQAMPCGLIVNELVTNVLKHAFPEGRKGDLIIRLGVLDGGRYQLAVRDTGVGLAQDIDLKNAETLGFQIVGDLVKQLEGSIEIVRDGGTEFILRF